MAQILEFYEGSIQSISFDVEDFVPLSGFKGSIQFRSEMRGLIMEFKTSNNTLLISDQSFVFTILPAQSRGMVGAGKWQLAIWTSDDELDEVKFEEESFNIKKAINQP